MRTVLFAALAALLATLSVAQAGTECNNGSYSNSSGSGTCSHTAAKPANSQALANFPTTGKRSTTQPGRE